MTIKFRKFRVFEYPYGGLKFTAKILCDNLMPDNQKLGLAVEWAIKNGKDLKGANLGGAYLAGLDLRDTDFRRSVFTGANFDGVKVAGAKFTTNFLNGAYNLPCEMTKKTLPNYVTQCWTTKRGNALARPFFGTKNERNLTC